MKGTQDQALVPERVVPGVGSMAIRYVSTYSGGPWWLTDADWLALERAGWRVQWGLPWFCYSRWWWHHNDPKVAPNAPSIPCPGDAVCPGHWAPSFKYAEQTGQRFLRSIASSAIREGLTRSEAIAEWESITGRSADEEGCACCSNPHGFYEVAAESSTS